MHYSLPSNSLYLFFFFFSAKILSGPYLWNRYSERLQIECAAWSCSLILHCCLQSNSLRYFFYFIFFFSRHDFATILSGHISGTVTRRDSKLSVLLGLQSNCAILLTIQFASLFFLFVYFFRHDFVRAISLEPLLAETPN